MICNQYSLLPAKISGLLSKPYLLSGSISNPDEFNTPSIKKSEDYRRRRHGYLQRAT